MEYKKKLIEVALPLEAINKESAREKSIRHGHPSTLHLWWARRPLAAARAVIWSSLVDDPSSLPEQFPTEEEQNVERERLFKILSELVKWENSNNQDILDTAKAEIMKSTNGNPPALLDPFAGGGAIPLEAQRLGLEAHASDLNPVAVMINKAMIEIPPKFAGQPPVNPDSKRPMNTVWTGAQGLAEDVRYYGEWMKQKAFERIGHLYPKAKDGHGQGHTVIAWIWARTVKCPNPACGCEMPLASSFELSKKKGKEAYVQPIVEGKTIRYEVKQGKDAPEPPKTARGAKFKCIRCDESTTSNYIKEEAKSDRMRAVLVGIVAEGNNGRLYLSPNNEHIEASKVQKPDDYPTQELANDPRNIWCPSYGLDTFDKLFTNRQLTALTTFSDLVNEVQQQVILDGGTDELAKNVAVYLAFLVDKLADYHSSVCSWNSSGEKMRNTFGRQAIPMVWDYSEANPFCSSSGSYNNMLDWVVKSLLHLPAEHSGVAVQQDAQTDIGLRNLMVSTDPPYYDNISYANLSDFFYVWLRRTMKSIMPDLFRTMLVPKAEELIASQYRFDGSVEKARDFFENGMFGAFKQINLYNKENIPVTVYYAFKQSDNSGDDVAASTGWETMLTAIIQAGFTITGTWPMRTELSVRMVSYDTNALASSIVLVCRKRPENSQTTTRRNFINTLKRELKPALKKLQASSIAPVDLAQSAIGPGMGVYSRYSKVLEADGTTMSVRSALQIINQELDLYFTEQDGELDRDSRFCVDLYTQYAFNDMRFGEADVLARAKNTSVEKLAGCGILYAQKGVVRLLARDEIPERTDREIIWLLTQQLTHAMEKDGVVGAAKIVSDIFTSEPEHAKALAYRLFTIAERKGWAQEAYAYNSLVIAWPDVQAKAAELQAKKSNAKQMTIFSSDSFLDTNDDDPLMVAEKKAPYVGGKSDGKD
jgi:putative DNA methylase